MSDFFSSPERLTILSTGLGRDSMTMQVLLARGELLVNGERLGPGGVDAIVFSDTGYEWPFTYAAIKDAQRLADAARAPFFILRKPPTKLWRGWKQEGTPPWVAGAPAGASPAVKAEQGVYHLRRPIADDYRRNRTIVPRVGGHCTVNHKILPVRRLLRDLTLARFGVTADQWGASVRAVHKGKRRPRWAQKMGPTFGVAPHRILIGFAADEIARLEGRGWNPGKGSDTWFAERLFPLAEAGIRKDDEAAILRSAGLDWIRKSGCYLCPMQPLAGFWALRELHPDKFADVQDYERRAVDKNPKMYILGDWRVSKRGGPAPYIEVLVDNWERRNVPPGASPAQRVQIANQVLDRGYDRRCTW